MLGRGCLTIAIGVEFGHNTKPMSPWTELFGEKYVFDQQW